MSQPIFNMDQLLYQFAKEVFRGEAALEGPTIIRVKNVMEDIISEYRSHIRGEIELEYSPGAVKYFELAVTALNAFLNGDKNTYKSLREAYAGLRNLIDLIGELKNGSTLLDDTFYKKANELFELSHKIDEYINTKIRPKYGQFINL